MEDQGGKKREKKIEVANYKLAQKSYF